MKVRQLGIRPIGILFLLCLAVSTTLSQIRITGGTDLSVDILRLSEELRGLMQEYPGVQGGSGSETRKLFEMIYKIRVSPLRTPISLRNGMLSGDNDYIDALASILNAWRTWTGLGSNSGQAFIIALRNAESFNTAWEVLPNQSKSRISTLMKANNITLSDGLDEEDLKWFYANRTEVEKIYDAMIDLEIQELRRIMNRKLEESTMFWKVFLQGAGIDNAGVYTEQIAAFKIQSGSLVREVANNGKGEIYIPPKNAYLSLALGKALVHEIGALWGFEHSLSQEIEQFFERWLNEGKPQKLNVPNEIRLAVSAQLGKASTDRHY